MLTIQHIWQVIIMQITSSPLNPGNNHEFKSKCLTCSHYEWSAAFWNKSTITYTEHTCDAECDACIPGDCVIWCDHFTPKVKG